MDFVNPYAHVSDIERAYCLPEEHFRVHYYQMPFQIIPAAIIEHLATSITDHITWFPMKGRVLTNYSPYAILSLKMIDYKSVSCIALGSTCRQITYIELKTIIYPKESIASTSDCCLAIKAAIKP